MCLKYKLSESGDYLVLWFLCETAEFSELQLDAGNLSYSTVRGPTRGMGNALPNVHVGIGNFRWGVEGWHQSRANVLL